MINVVYLVLVFEFGFVEKIPQASLAQCQTNAKNHVNKDYIRRATCIVGVK